MLLMEDLIGGGGSGCRPRSCATRQVIVYVRVLSHACLGFGQLADDLVILTHVILLCLSVR